MTTAHRVPALFSLKPLSPMSLPPPHRADCLQLLLHRRLPSYARSRVPLPLEVPCSALSCALLKEFTVSFLATLRLWGRGLFYLFVGSLMLSVWETG